MDIERNEQLRDRLRKVTWKLKDVATQTDLQMSNLSLFRNGIRDLGDKSLEKLEYWLDELENHNTQKRTATRL